MRNKLVFFFSLEKDMIERERFFLYQRCTFLVDIFSHILFQRECISSRHVLSIDSSSQRTTENIDRFSLIVHLINCTNRWKIFHFLMCCCLRIETMTLEMIILHEKVLTFSRSHRDKIKELFITCERKIRDFEND